MVGETMRALYLDEAEGVEGATVADRPRPSPGPGEVRVALRAAALNHREIWIAKGRYPGISLPATLGADGAGVIDVVGEGVDEGLIGAEVMLYPGLEWGDDPAIPSPAFALLGMPGPGTIAEAICVRADRVVVKPAFLSFVEAAAWPLAGLTAWRALFTKGRFASGETVLITGAGGGVAGCAIAIAAAAGARVFVTSSSAETIAAACAAGAMGGVDYRADDWGVALHDLSGGIDIVIDASPSQGYGHYRRAMRRGGRIVIYGAGGGPDFSVTAPELFLANLSVIGTNMGNVEEFGALVEFLETHALRAPIDRIFPLESAADALLHLERSNGRGKVVVEIGGAS